MKEKITIIFKNNPDIDDEFDSGTHSVDYYNTKIIFQGEHILLETKNKEYNSVEIHPLKTIKAFRYNNINSDLVIYKK